MTKYNRSRKPNLRNKKNQQKRRPIFNNGNATQEQGDSRSLPKPTSVLHSKPAYNPTWNPQFLKVARKFQYSAPAADVTAGFGKIQDPAVGPSNTVLNYTSGALSFKVSDIYNVSEFGAMFDQYMLAMVALDFEYMSCSETVSPLEAGLSQQCTLMLYEDNDDVTAQPATNTGWQAVYESGRAIKKVFPSKDEQRLTYRLCPKFLTADVDTSSTTTGRSLRTGWCDGATGLDVIHYGLKYMIQANPSVLPQNHLFRVTATYYMKWRARQ